MKKQTLMQLILGVSMIGLLFALSIRMLMERSYMELTVFLGLAFLQIAVLVKALRDDTDNYID